MLGERRSLISEKSENTFVTLVDGAVLVADIEALDDLLDELALILGVERRHNFRVVVHTHTDQRTIVAGFVGSKRGQVG